MSCVILLRDTCHVKTCRRFGYTFPNRLRDREKKPIFRMSKFFLPESHRDRIARHRLARCAILFMGLCACSTMKVEQLAPGTLD